MNTENAKKKFNAAKARLVQLMQERPLETLAAISAAALASAKLIHSVSEARNASSWRREVRRREDAQRRGAYDNRRR